MTNAIFVQPIAAPIPPSGTWAPGGKRYSGVEYEDVFSSSSQWDEENSMTSTTAFSHSSRSSDATQDALGGSSDTVSLSQLLDNAVILEECIKELAAFIHARRALGIDVIRYL